ncbi:hypothetical protein ASZ78_016922 [Callipepla squamata]|uniref:Amino acid transporter transmembrane domain-containing protein n=1 Tax=Callipepla squamata TaxID=9009 RepID=A0A226N2B9_CALSU|nr:hypothetical protein ASZ78_016922 [Callipepla squamata]
MLESADHSVDRMELQKVNIELEEQSNSGESLEDNYTELIDSEKAAIRSPFARDDAESQKFLTNGYLDKKKLEKYNEEYHRGRASFGMSSFNLSNAIMGSGILGLSYAMANTGIILFVVLLLSVAMLSLYSVHLLLKTSKEGGSLIYEKLGEKAFGWPGKCSVFISVTMQNIGGKGYLGYTSGFSLTCMVFFVSVVIFKKFQIPCPLPVMDQGVGNWTATNITLPVHLVMLPNESLSSGVNFMMDNTAGHTPDIEETRNTFLKSSVEYEAHSDISGTCQPKYFVFNSRTAYAIPILAFAFVCHPEVLPIYSELKDRSRKRMQNVSNISITGMLIMYLLAGLFGYLTFYGEVEDELLHTYTRVYTFDALLLSVRLAVLVAVTLTVPLVLFPIRSSISALLFPKRPFSWIRHLLIAAVILAFNNMLVIFVPAIKDIFGFIGASSATMLIFILPSAFYLRLVKKEPMRSTQKIGALVFLIVGIIFMIVSMTLIVMDWIYNSPSSRHH